MKLHSSRHDQCFRTLLVYVTRTNACKCWKCGGGKPCRWLRGHQASSAGNLALTTVIRVRVPGSATGRSSPPPIDVVQGACWIVSRNTREAHEKSHACGLARPMHYRLHRMVPITETWYRTYLTQRRTQALPSGCNRRLSISLQTDKGNRTPGKLSPHPL